jgi:hypothetical protein
MLPSLFDTKVPNGEAKIASPFTLASPFVAKLAVID